VLYSGDFIMDIVMVFTEQLFRPRKRSLGKREIKDLTKRCVTRHFLRIACRVVVSILSLTNCKCMCLSSK